MGRRPGFARAAVERIKERLSFDPATGCWSLPSNNGNGYARCRGDDGRMVYAHRAMFTAACGEPAPGLVIDHLCRNRSCVNPAHLEAVTIRENGARGIKGALTTHCPHGHPYDADNTLFDRGARRCRACHTAKERERRNGPQAVRLR